MNGSSYVKVPLRSSAMVNIQNDDKYCFLWSILAHLHSIADSKNGHATTVANYRQKFNELHIAGFDFTNGSRSSDVHKSERLNNLSIKIFELSFH